jgi:hypothetical protein
MQLGGGSMVSLEEFISETLVQIVRGARKAQSELGSTGCVNPPAVQRTWQMPKPGRPSEPGEDLVVHVKHDVQFDVQVTATSISESHGNVAVKLHVFSVGTDGKSSNDVQHVNRVQFSIPLTLQTAAPLGDLE